MDQSTLDYYNKHTTVEMNERAVRALHDSGIGVVAGFIIGAPGETLDDILRNLDAFLDLPLFAINCSILSPDPGTAEFGRARRRDEAFRELLGGPDGRRLVPDPARFGTDSPVGLPTVSCHLTKADLNALQTLVEAEFYLRPAVYSALIERRSPEQRALIDEWYTYLRATARELHTDGLSPAVSDLVNALKVRLLHADLLEAALIRR